MGIEPAPLGLVGRVIEPNMRPVSGGTVYLVPAEDVQTLAETEIDLFASPSDTAALDNDEPLEDLIETNGDSYVKATVDDSGVYRFETLPDDDSFGYFIVWVPAAGDTEHLPGGDSSSVALATASLVGMQMDIRVSSQPSESATYVGSSTCMGCHGLHSTTRTAHNVGLQLAGVRSILQDIEPWPDFDDALIEEFQAEAILYYYNCDGAKSGISKCEVARNTDPTDPGPPEVVVWFEVQLKYDETKQAGQEYSVELVNRLGAQETQSYDIVLTYGGALGKQQYLARRENTDESGRVKSFTYFVLPMQYNYEGDFANESSDDWLWRDYRSDLWYDFNNVELIQPDDLDDSESFDNNCAGCHFTGYRLEGSAGAGWSARAVVDSGGSFDYDGDGRVELINVGCESCHGPGSGHLVPSPTGRNIVSPGLLTPGRQAMLCGSCHSRPLGVGGGKKGLPLSEENQMPPPGIRRADFAVSHTTRVSGDPNEDFFDSGDAFGNYQQYSDLIRSQHYRNPVRIVGCTGCHSPHANSRDVYGTEIDNNLNAVCTVCHSSEEFLTVIEHVNEQVAGGVHDSVPRDFRCTECHMVPTAKSGASVPALLDGIPSDAPPVQYYWNDIASHRFEVTGRDRFAEQPVAATNQCAPCHGIFFPN